MIPDLIKGKICHSARIAGHLEGAGDYPRCIGEMCSQYPECIFNALNYRVEIEKARKTAIVRRVLSEMEKEGEQ